jgi:hypothetical protein
LALQWWLSSRISRWLSRTGLSNLCRRYMRGYSTKHPLHAWAKYADHHLLEHVQESSMMLSHHSFYSLPKTIQSLLFLLKRCGIRFPWQQNPGHVRFKVRDANLFLLNDIKHFCWNWSMASFSCVCCSGDRSLMVMSMMSSISGILIHLDGSHRACQKVC